MKTLQAVALTQTIVNINRFARSLSEVEREQFCQIDADLVAKIWQAASVSALELLSEIQEDANVQL